MDPITIGVAVLGSVIGTAIGNHEKKKKAEKSRIWQEEYEAKQRREAAIELQKQTIKDNIDRSSKTYLSDLEEIAR